MNPPQVPKETIRQYLVTRQGFNQATGRQGTLETLQQLGCVQVDPLKVIHNNHHLVFYSRVTDYSPKYLDDLLYDSRQAFMYWCKQKSLLPMTDYPYFRYRMRQTKRFHSSYYERTKQEEHLWRPLIQQIRRILRKDSPQSSRTLSQQYNLNQRNVTKVLNLLWDNGTIMIHHEQGNLRYYAFTNTLIPQELLDKRVTAAEYRAFKIHKYLHAYGLIDLRDPYFGWVTMKMPDRKRLIQDLINQDHVTPITIPGVNTPYYLLTSDWNTFSKLKPPPENTILPIAPLDNLIWNRAMITELYDFQYTWDVYKPPHQRQYGYYDMPLLQGTTFIGRMDPKHDRQHNQLIIKSIHLESPTVSSSLTQTLAEALIRFQRFIGATTTDIQATDPPSLKPKLQKLLTP